MATDDSKKQHHALERVENMKVSMLQTAFYGPDGKRIKHQVHTGALQMPASVLDLYEKPTKTYPLPSLESLVRPSLDDTIDNVVITYVQRLETTEDCFDEMTGQYTKRHSVQFKSQNKIGPSRIRGAGEPERIRGGGDDDDVEMKDATTSAVAPAPASTNPPETPATNPEAPTAAAAVMPPVTKAEAPAASTEMEAKPEPLATNTMTVSKPVPASNAQSETKAEAPAASTEMEAKPEPLATNTMTVSKPVPASNAQSETTAAQPEAQPTSLNSQPEPTTTTSSSVATAADKSAPPPQVVPLQKRPAEQYESLTPSADVRGSSDMNLTLPDWYDSNSVSDLERSLMPEWFDGSATHRTETTYKAAREKLMELSQTLGHTRYVSFTLARRSIPGDAGSLLKLHTFLSNYGLINADALNESTPTPIIFTKKQKKTHAFFSQEFIAAVAEQARKGPPIDWHVIASKTGLSAIECERLFITTPIETMEDVNLPEATEQEQESLKALIEAVNPEALKTVISAAIESTKDSAEAQKASQVGVLVQQAATSAKQENEALSTILSHVVELRMQKLENRLRALDDVEGMLDSERMALNLERRDLYTARCRHWFGGV